MSSIENIRGIAEIQRYIGPSKESPYTDEFIENSLTSQLYGRFLLNTLRPGTIVSNLSKPYFGTQAGLEHRQKVLPENCFDKQGNNYWTKLHVLTYCGVVYPSLENPQVTLAVGLTEKGEWGFAMRQTTQDTESDLTALYEGIHNRPIWRVNTEQISYIGKNRYELKPIQVGTQAIIDTANFSSIRAFTKDALEHYLDTHPVANGVVFQA